jgi:hypothetical protein
MKGGDITIDAHSVTAGTDAILARNFGTGTPSVTVDGTISGGAGGIITRTGTVK